MQRQKMNTGEMEVKGGTIFKMEKETELEMLYEELGLCDNMRDAEHLLYLIKCEEGRKVYKQMEEERELVIA